MHIDTYNLTAGSPLQSTMEEEQLSTSSAFSKWPDALSWSLIGSAHTNQMLCEPLRPTAPSDRHVGEIPCSSKTWFNQISWELPPTTTTQQKLDPHTHTKSFTRLCAGEQNETARHVRVAKLLSFSRKPSWRKDSSDSAHFGHAQYVYTRQDVSVLITIDSYI